MPGAAPPSATSTTAQARVEGLPDGILLRGSVAFVWLWTGLAVIHPYYRYVGHQYLAPLGLPDAVMYATCAAEVLLALRVALGRAAGWVTALQIILILGFTAILLGVDPMMLMDPYGMLVKNLTLLAVIGTAWLVEREGWSVRAWWLLRGGVAAIWILEGTLPKIVCQQQPEIDVVAGSGLVPFDPCLFLRILGAVQTTGGILLLLTHGRLLQCLLLFSLLGLLVLPVLVGWQDPLLWVHPFGPLSKNVPIIAGTCVLLRHCDHRFSV